MKKSVTVVLTERDYTEIAMGLRERADDWERRGWPDRARYADGLRAKLLNAFRHGRAITITDARD